MRIPRFRSRAILLRARETPRRCREEPTRVVGRCQLTRCIAMQRSVPPFGCTTYEHIAWKLEIARFSVITHARIRVRNDAAVATGGLRISPFPSRGTAAPQLIRVLLPLSPSCVRRGLMIN